MEIWEVWQMKVWKKIVLGITFGALALGNKITTQAEIIWFDEPVYDQWGVTVCKSWNGYCYGEHGVVNGVMSESELIDLHYEVEYDYERAYAMVDLLNEERRKAGVPEIEAKDCIMEAAMKRAAETALYWAHGRPNGYTWGTVSMFVEGENIAVGYDTAKKAVKGLATSSGHYTNMIDEEWDYFGCGCVKVNGEIYWVQNFCSAENKYEEGCYNYKDHSNDIPIDWSSLSYGEKKSSTEVFRTKFNKAYLEEKGDFLMNAIFDKKYVYHEVENVRLNKPQVDKSAYTMSNKQKKKMDFILSVANYTGWYTYIKVNDQIEIEMLNDVCEYQNGYVVAKKEGIAKMKVSLSAEPSINTTINVKVTKEIPQDTNRNVEQVTDGMEVVAGGNRYIVTNAKTKTVKLVKSKEEATVNIPANIKINGKKYKVTEFSVKAFRENKVVQYITLGHNIRYVGKAAFRGCDNLKSIYLGRSVRNIGDYAFAGCEKLKKASLGGSTKTVGCYAFAGCSKLKQLDCISSDLLTIEKYAFYGCSDLVKAKFRSLKLKRINQYAFKDCENLKELIIKSKKLSYVSKNALKGANNQLIVKVASDRYRKTKKLFKGYKVKTIE